LPYADLPDEDARFVQEFKGKFANMAGQILQQVINPNFQVKFFIKSRSNSFLIEIL